MKDRARLSFSRSLTLAAAVCAVLAVVTSERSASRVCAARADEKSAMRSAVRKSQLVDYYYHQFPRILKPTVVD